MSNAATKVSQALVHYRESFESAQKAAKILAGGPADWYFGRIEEYVRALFEKFAPFKEGDRVALVADVPNVKGTHWAASAHFLVRGSEGVVSSADYYDDCFWADVVFDGESWYDREQVKHAVKPENRHTYMISERLLIRTTEPTARCEKISTTTENTAIS